MITDADEKNETSLNNPNNDINNEDSENKGNDNNNDANLQTNNEKEDSKKKEEEDVKEIPQDSELIEKIVNEANDNKNNPHFIPETANQVDFSLDKNDPRLKMEMKDGSCQFYSFLYVIFRDPSLKRIFEPKVLKTDTDYYILSKVEGESITFRIPCSTITEEKTKNRGNLFPCNEEYVSALGVYLHALLFMKCGFIDRLAFQPFFSTDAFFDQQIRNVGFGFSLIFNNNKKDDQEQSNTNLQSQNQNENENQEKSNTNIENESQEKSCTNLENQNENKSQEKSNTNLENENQEKSNTNLENENQEKSSTNLENEKQEKSNTNLENENQEQSNTNLENEKQEKSNTILENEKQEKTNANLENESQEKVGNNIETKDKNENEHCNLPHHLNHLPDISLASKQNRIDLFSDGSIFIKDTSEFLEGHYIICISIFPKKYKFGHCLFIFFNHDEKKWKLYNSCPDEEYGEYGEMELEQMKSFFFNGSCIIAGVPNEILK